MIKTTDSLNGSPLKDTIQSIQRDEDDAISTLCSILSSVEASGKVSCLTHVAGIMKKWPDCPPSMIVEELQAVELDEQ